MDEKTALEELQFIRNVINETKNSVLHNGLDYIVWGVLIIAGMLINYYCIINQIYFHYIWIWVVTISLGWVYSLYNSKNHHKKQPKTYSGKIVGAVWLAAGIAMTLTGFVGVLSGTIRGAAISPLLSMIIGSAYFVTGIVLSSRWFSRLSFGWWAGAVLMFFVASIHSFLIMAAMMLFFQTIPGIIIYKKYKQETRIA